MVKQKCFAVFVLVALLLSAALPNATSTAVAAEGGPGTNLPDPTSDDSSIAQAMPWQTYTDTRFDFTIIWSRSKPVIIGATSTVI